VLEHLHARQAGDAGRHRSAGFTLVELFVVLVILAGLVGVVVYSLSGIKDRSQKSICQTAARDVRTAEETKFADDGSYATDLAALAPQYLPEAPDPGLLAASGTTPTALLLSYGPDCRGVSGLTTP